jgi:hypothetical protein
MAADMMLRLPRWNLGEVSTCRYSEVCPYGVANLNYGFADPRMLTATAADTGCTRCPNQDCQTCPVHMPHFGACWREHRCAWEGCSRPMMRQVASPMRGVDLVTCGRCKAVRYCSVAHQQLDKAFHTYYCLCNRSDLGVPLPVLSIGLNPTRWAAFCGVGIHANERDYRKARGNAMRAQAAWKKYLEQVLERRQAASGGTLTQIPAAWNHIPEAEVEAKVEATEPEEAADSEGSDSDVVFIPRSVAPPEEVKIKLEPDSDAETVGDAESDGSDAEPDSDCVEVAPPSVPAAADATASPPRRSVRALHIPRMRLTK